MVIVSELIAASVFGTSSHALSIFQEGEMNIVAMLRLIMASMRYLSMHCVRY